MIDSEYVPVTLWALQVAAKQRHLSILVVLHGLLAGGAQDPIRAARQAIVCADELERLEAAPPQAGGQDA